MASRTADRARLAGLGVALGRGLRARRNSEMAAMADVLSGDDIKGMAAHYSREKARAVVFVTVPGK
jgi:cytochrome c553